MDRCPGCGSDNIYFSKKRQVYVCEDCELEFAEESPEIQSKTIFFSYAHDENEWLVQKLKGDIEQRGHKVWIDRSEIKSGDDWRQSITEGLLSSSGVIAFLSKHSVRIPGVCLDELRIALSVKNGNIKTVLLEDESEVSPPTSVSGIQWLDMSCWKSMRTNCEKDWDAWYNNKLNEIIRVIEDESFASFSGDIENIKRTFDISLSDTKEQMLISHTFVGRRWLSEMLEEWRLNDSSSRVFILYGGPGIGKSTFAAHQIHYNPHVMCGFFCEWDKDGQRITRNVIKNISFKLATRLPDYRKILLAKIVARGADFLSGLSDADLFDQLLTQPLSELIDGGRERCLLVIDGLDEAGDDDNNVLADLLADNLYKLPHWIGVVLTSRPEGAVKRAFGRYNAFECNPLNRDHEADIKEYFEYYLSTELEGRPNRSEIIEKLLDNCEGSFLYAAMFVEGVQKREIDLNNISAYPVGLDAIYLQNFRRKYPTLDSYTTPRRILELIVSSDRMPLRMICDIVGVDNYTFRAFRETIGSILIENKKPVGSDGAECISYSFCHKSVRDWIVNSEKCGRYFVDIASAYNTTANYYRAKISKKYISEDQVVTVEDYLKRYIQSNILDVYSKLNKWGDIESFLLEQDTPLYPYWKCINNFPSSWDMNTLLEFLWANENCVSFFNMMQRFGERKFVFDVLEMFKNKFGISSFHHELFESYVDVVHLGGGYREAVQLYDEYLEHYAREEIIENPTLLHYSIRRIHHSMFFAPVKDLIDSALELISHMDPDKTPKDYNEILFLLGGNLGILSGDFVFASEWLKKAEIFANKIGDGDFQKRAARKQVDLLCLNGEFGEAMRLVQIHTSLEKEVKSRYEVYLLGALGETYRQIGDFDNAKRAFKKLLSLTKLKGLTGWECHAYLGLANLECEFKTLDINKINRYLEAANAIYQKSGLVWGIVNSEIVRCRAYRKVDCVAGEHLVELMRARELATSVDYTYETMILDKLIKGKSVDNYRLLFL